MNPSAQDYLGNGVTFDTEPIFEIWRTEAADSSALIIEPDVMRTVGLRSLLVEELEAGTVSTVRTDSGFRSPTV